MQFIGIDDVENLREFLDNKTQEVKQLSRGVGGCVGKFGSHYQFDIIGGEPTGAFAIYDILSFNENDLSVPSFLRGTTRHFRNLAMLVSIWDNGEVSIGGVNYTKKCREESIKVVIGLKVVSDFLPQEPAPF